MLMCWNEQPLKRPTFTELRSRFDSMLLADKHGDYIDLRIDQNKLYYQLVSSTSMEAACTGEDLKLKKQSSDTTLKSHSSQSEMERTRSKSPVATLSDALPGLKSSCASCMDQASASQSRPQFLTLERGTTTAGSSGMLGPGGSTAGRADRTYENAGRPVSMYLSGDRERRDNPYVDEPSLRMAAATSLTLSNGELNGHAGGQWRSDGAIEMSQLDDGYVKMNGGVKGQTGLKQNGPEIKISFSED